MGKRRLSLALTDDEDDVPPPPRPAAAVEDEGEKNPSKRKKLMLCDEEDDEEQQHTDEEERDEEEEEEEEEEVGELQEDARPVGEVVRKSGKGRGLKHHYNSFEYDGLHYDLEDPVLLSPEGAQKPYVAIIKDIFLKLSDESLMVTGQWFYRPEEAEKKGGGSWLSRDTRELFYSFHRDDIPAESVMHKCVVHFIPKNKQLPYRKQHPGFIVQKVYDTDQRRLFKLTDKDYEDNKQEEIDVLVNKTIARIGVFRDIEAGDTHAEYEDHLKNRRMLKRRNMSNLDVSRDDEITTRSGQSLKLETPGSVANNTSEYYTILSSFKALTGEASRDKWLEKLLQGMQFMSHGEKGQAEKDKGGSQEQDGTTNGANESHEKNTSDKANFIWPDAIVPGVISLEKAAHEFSSDFTKYNQKMRQLVFNLKNNSVLATRLLKGELEASKILSMSPAELKEGLTAEELASKQPEKATQMQMTDARCKRCSEKQVGLKDIIQAGHGARYQLECTACGNTWYASRDEIDILTVDGTNSSKPVGTVPLATAKFENFEKRLVSPRESNKTADEIFKKTTEAYMPVLETQRSLKKPKDA